MLTCLLLHIIQLKACSCTILIFVLFSMFSDKFPPILPISTSSVVYIPADNRSRLSLAKKKRLFEAMKVTRWNHAPTRVLRTSKNFPTRFQAETMYIYVYINNSLSRKKKKPATQYAPNCDIVANRTLSNPLQQQKSTCTCCAHRTPKTRNIEHDFRSDCPPHQDRA